MQPYWFNEPLKLYRVVKAAAVEPREGYGRSADGLTCGEYADRFESFSDTQMFTVLSSLVMYDQISVHPSLATDV